VLDLLDDRRESREPLENPLAIAAMDGLMFFGIWGRGADGGGCGGTGCKKTPEMDDWGVGAIVSQVDKVVGTGDSGREGLKTRSVLDFRRTLVGLFTSSMMGTRTSP
jgi:hypothetical protein